MKRYIHTALLYAVLAMAGGVFYREFTRFTGYTGKTALSVVHTHYFLLGMVFFLLLLLLEKSFRFTTHKTGPVLAVYHAGLNLTALMLAVRGVVQVLGSPLSSGLDAAISGIAGIGHVLLGVSLLFFEAILQDCRPAVWYNTDIGQTARGRTDEAGDAPGGLRWPAASGGFCSDSGGTFYLAHRGGYGSHFGGTAFVPAQGRDGKKRSLKALAPWLRSAGNVL